MILLKVDDRNHRRRKTKIKYRIVDEETKALINSGEFEQFGEASDKYYELKDEYGSANVKMVLE